MPNEPIRDADRWAKRMQDVLADNSKIRDNLQDDDAIPFMEWGAACAKHLGARLAVPDAPEPDEEQVDEMGYTLGRLMIRLNWLVTYRHKKDKVWLTHTFAMVNKLSQDTYGAMAPTLSDEEIAAWLADHDKHTNAELIRDLMARYTPASLAEPDEADTATEPGTEPGDEGAPQLLSNAVFGAFKRSAAPVESESPQPSQGEEDGEEIE